MLNSPRIVETKKQLLVIVLIAAVISQACSLTIAPTTPSLTLTAEPADTPTSVPAKTPTTMPTVTSVPTPVSLPSLQPPLADVEFPLEPAQYPPDWPDELKLPEEFILVDSSSGTLADSTTKGWSAKSRFKGKPLEASETIITAFVDRGWTIIENNQLDSGGFILLMQLQQGNGIVVIDADPNNLLETLVIFTVFP